jgi:riboflavin biosynthesis pyrimidine reductase
MRPYVICHMGSSVDGRIVPSEWPEDLASKLGETYEEIHRDLDGDAWLVGRVSMAEFGEGAPNPARAIQPYARETWIAPDVQAGPYAVAIDRHGKLQLNINRANGDPIVLILAETVSDDHLEELRRDGISYLFGGVSDIDLGVALERLRAEFGVKRLLLEGGGAINGSFLGAGLVDEISLLLMPVADGHSAVPTTFDNVAGTARKLALKSIERLKGDLLHIRYLLT